MSSSGDRAIYNDNIENEVPTKPFINKEKQIIYDLNQGVYSGSQIQFSTASLQSGSGKWIDFQNSYIEIPFTYAMKSDADISAISNQYMMGLKNGSIQLVDSIVLQYNGTQIAQQSAFTNIQRNFRILNEFTLEDFKTWGPSTFVSTDNVLSSRYSAGASPYGDGVSNNTVSMPTGQTPTLLRTNTFETNYGYEERLKFVQNGASAVNGFSAMAPSDLAYKGQSYYAETTGAAAAKVYVWQCLLTLRLKDLHDFFNHIPLIKGGRIDLIINFNSANGSITTAAGPPITLVNGSYSQTAGRSNPVMMSSAVATGGTVPYPSQPLAGVSGLITWGCGINGVSGVPVLAGLQSPFFQNCRWYVDVYEMNSEYESQLIAANPTKTIYYNDFYTYTSITNVSGSTQAVLSAGVKNPKYLIMVPVINSVQYTTAGLVTPQQNIFDSFPGTLGGAPNVGITNLQVFVGGKNLFPLISQYSWQNYLDEVSTLYGVNGGKSIMTSGMLSYRQWVNNPVYVADLGRRLPADDASSKSISVSFTVSGKSPQNAATAAALDFICFVVYGRSATFNMLNGNLVDAQ